MLHCSTWRRAPAPATFAARARARSSYIEPRLPAVLFAALCAHAQGDLKKI